VNKPVQHWPHSATKIKTLVSRVQEYLLKAIKEAKVNCSWIDPHEGWIQSVRKFVSAIIPRSATSSSDPFLQSFEPFAADIAQAGAINSLAQTVLKLTSPGVPDIYQGNELWDFSLVDPDNRRPVDYDHRQKLLAGLTDDVHPAQLLLHWQDGRIKMFVTTKILKFRRENPRVFESGSYQPLKATGKFAENVVAFVREWADLAVMVIVPRLSTQLGFPPVGNCWSDTALSLEGPGSWKSLFHDKNVGVQTELKISSLLEDFPVAVLVRV
jgi:(1->4)-alpha-D-glucan 1-alpha-D-glucosylmutase